MSSRTVVVLPTYNEVDNVAAIIGCLLALPERPDVLVVDDSSPDGTGAAVRDLAERLPTGRVRLHTRRAREGLAAAYRDGFGQALELGYDVVVQMDADGSHPVEAVARLLEALDAGADVAVGSRYVPGGDVTAEWAWVRRALSSGGNRYARLMLGLPYRDLTSGFKAWRAATLASIQPVGGDLSGYAFQIHTTLSAHRRGAKVVEVPFFFHDRQRGTSKMSTRIAFEAVFAVRRMRAEVRRAGVSVASSSTG